MYNKAKYLTDKIGSILSIIVGALMLLGSFFTLITLFKACDAVNELGGKINGSTLFVVFIALAIRIGISFFFISFGLQTMGEPLLYKNNRTNTSMWCYAPKGKDITLVVFSAIFFLGGVFLSDFTAFVGDIGFSTLSWAQWILNLLYLGILVLKIVALCINGNSSQQQSYPASASAVQKTYSNQQVAQNFTPAPQQPVTQPNNSIEDKIKELKHLKDLCVITEEQYQNAITQLITKASK